MTVLRACGWGEGTVEFEVFHRDTLGQTLGNLFAGAFPVDQLCLPGWAWRPR